MFIIAEAVRLKKQNKKTICTNYDEQKGDDQIVRQKELIAGELILFLNERICVISIFVHFLAGAGNIAVFTTLLI